MADGLAVQNNSGLAGKNLEALIEIESHKRRITTRTRLSFMCRRDEGIVGDGDVAALLPKWAGQKAPRAPLPSNDRA